MEKGHINQNKKKVQEIIGLIKNQYMVNFATKFLEELSEDNLSTLSSKVVSRGCENAYNIIKKKFKGNFIIDIDIENESADYAILTIVCFDTPFIIDSINNELQSRDIDINLFSHKAFNPKDYENYQFTNIGNNKITVLQFYISNWFDNNFYNKLIAKISEILECTKVAVDDWKDMKNSLSVCIDNLTKSLELKENVEINQEYLNFLKFLSEDNFIFLGYTHAISSNVNDFKIAENKNLGLLKRPKFINEIELLNNYQFNNGAIIIRKSETKTKVHRKSYMLCISVKNYDSDGRCISIDTFFGFLITKVYYMSVLNIPLIRDKIHYVIKKYGYPKDSYNAKELVSALEDFPRSELLQISQNDLYKIASGIVSLTINPRIKLFIREDKAKKYISSLIFVPKTKFNTQVRQRIEHILCSQFGGFVAKHYVKIGEGQLTRLQLIINLPDKKIPNYDTNRVEKLIASTINAWDDNLKEVLNNNFNKKEADKLFKKYQDVLNVQYTTSFSPEQAIHDINAIEEALAKNKVVFKIYNSAKSSKSLIQLKIFSLENELHLSTIFPIIDNLGLFIIDVATFETRINHSGVEVKVFIHYFRTKPKSGEFTFNNTLQLNLEEGLEKIWNNTVEDDVFNNLIFYAGINYREANLLRAYAKYLKQIRFEFSIEYILNTLVKNSILTKSLIDLFRLRFNPDLKYTSSAEKEILNNVHEMLSKISVFVEDKILSTFLCLILATKRTNFFLIDKATDYYKDYISLKIHSREIEDMPLPKPEVDTFVYSSVFEAIHLRGAKIARGGIRWTDRTEDFRKVVLDLMKAQMTKNSLIVPSGCKGAFVLKYHSSNSEDFLKFGIACYKNFLRGILDITDNIVNKKITNPKNIIRHDEDDPYFVVAADKGTATFSDYANGVSKEYNFWLDDAFASGGSAGYDHKQIGITAKGAWICAKYHFSTLNIDLDKDNITAVGVGDMSGDVFGNGMLLSKKMKLLAAFNHLHIFLDPNPNPEVSFKERQRLFNNTRLKWTDYNSKLISKGGGVYERTVKEICISPEVKVALGISADKLSPSQLISAILKAPVDLLWNGGIGTYVKGEFEDNNDIGDKANDNLRILGKNLRCKVVGEGGNLGFTQKGRVEFAKRGGLINTDFIDNSGGVDCSDHEVNIKIALQHEIEQKNINLEERNKILNKLSSDIETLVLEDNHNQSILLNMESYSDINNLKDYSWLINCLEEKGELLREVESLPSQEEITKLELEKKSLTRPEIAVLVAYAKNSIAKILNSFDFTKEDFFQKILLSYFPKYLQQNFEQSIMLHKLSNEIIITVISNEFVNTLGCTTFHLLKEEKGFDVVAIMKAFYIIMQSVDVKNILKEINGTSLNISSNSRYKLLNKLQTIIKAGINCILMHYSEINDIDPIVLKQKNGFVELCNLFSKDEYFDTIIKKQTKKINGYIKEDENSKKLILNIVYFSLINSFFDIITIKQSSKINIDDIAKVYFKIRDRLYIEQILELINNNNDADHTEKLAYDYIENELRKITVDIVNEQLKDHKNIDSFSFIKDEAKLKSFDDFIAKILLENNENSFVLIQVIINKLKELIRSKHI
jgi:glutamate dehydrogenase